MARLNSHSVVGHGYYRLNKKGEPVECRSLGEWARSYERNRRIARTVAHGLAVSTVFLGIDGSHGFGEPQLFETMIFRVGGDDGPNGGWIDYQRRYPTLAAALFGHAAAVAWVESQYS